VRRAALLVAAGGATLLAVPAAVTALPPGGPAENPGTPPATVRIETPQVAAGGRVAFSGTGFLTGKGVPQKVYVKLDDHGDNGIGPFTASADGALAGSVALTDPEAPADVGDATKEHWVRFLAGPSGKYPDNAPARSLKATFRVLAAPVARVGTGALRVRGGRVALRLRAAPDAGATGTATLRAGGVRIARGRFTLAGGAARTVALALTAGGKRRLAHGRTLAARLTLTVAGRAVPPVAATVKGAA
jgi:hypothetical protein